ncbi:E3 ubiquitin-protein ligase HACE1-like [Dysidea avara]|uniref:E3 ubiquitin-protein ligase HACE1-like n=1 Tax=Dysidea avara TaxID=196820 RepID=UPI00331C8864
MSSGNTRRSSRLQEKREKFLTKSSRKRCRIADDSDSRSDSSENSSDDCEAANTSFSKHEPRYEVGSRGGNFTRVYNSYNKETRYANTLDIYEDDFIDDGMDDEGASSSTSSSSNDETAGTWRQQNDDGSQLAEEDSQLVTSMRSNRKRRLEDDSSDEDSSDGAIVVRKKQTPVRTSSRTVSLREKKEAKKMQNFRDLKQTRSRKQAGLPIGALEDDSDGEEDDGNDEGEVDIDDDDDDKFVVSDSEVVEQSADLEHQSDWCAVLRPLMGTGLFTTNHIEQVKKKLSKKLKGRKVVDYDELLEALVGGATEDVVEIFSQLSHSNLCSIVAQLVLQLAVYYGHPSLVEIAIKYKADPNTTDDRGIVPLTLAAACGQYECFKLLLSLTTLQPVLAKHPTLLHVIVEAALCNEGTDSSYDILQLLFEEKRELFDRMMSSSTHPTVLELAIWCGRVMCVSFLLEHYPELLSSSSNTHSTAVGFPPSLIMLAVCSPYQQEVGNSVILDVLLEQQVGTINVRDSKGWTALMWSTFYQNTDCMRSLLDNDALVYCPDDHGTSCLHIAALLGSSQCAQLLISHDHPIDCVDGKGWPPLLYANFSSERECVLSIMKSKPNQLLVLGKLLERNYDVESEAKRKTYLQVQKVLEAVAQHEAYYAIFNQFVSTNPDILMEEGGGSSTFLQKCKDLLDLNNKKQWFRRMIDKMKNYIPPDCWCDCTLLRDVRRESVLMSAYNKLKYTSPSSLRAGFDVTFYNEPGIAAGPRREFWSCFSKEVVSKYYLFKKCDNSHYMLMPHELLVEGNHHGCPRNISVSHLGLLKFIGKMLAVAVSHKEVINFRLAHPLVKQLIGMPLVYPDDLETVDSESYQNFHSFGGDISDLGLSFAAFLQCPYCEKKPESFSLRDYSRSSHCDEVTEENKNDFIKAFSSFKLEISIEKELEAFQNGFWEMIPVEYLRIFTPDQFSLLLSGIPTIDVDDWKDNTEYSPPSIQSSDVVVWFWSLVRSLPEEEKALLLKFATGSPRVPVGGFAHLEGISGLTKFRISFISGEDRVPEASTCFNNLKLSQYTSEQQCRDKVLIAIRFGCEGFSFA